MNIKLKYWDVRHTAEAVVAQFGDDHKLDASGCLYVRQEDNLFTEDGNYVEGEWIPVCLVGQILAKHGIPLKPMDSIGVLSLNRESFEALGLVLTDKAFFYLDNLQAVQDDGLPWGVALRLGSKMISRHTFGLDEKFLGIGGRR